MSRRTFLKVGGLVAGGAIAGWLGLNWLAPEMVPGQRGVKYISADEYFKIINDLYSYSCLDSTYKAGDTLYIKDMAFVHPVEIESSHRIYFRIGSEFTYGPWVLMPRDDNLTSMQEKTIRIVSVAIIPGRSEWKKSTAAGYNCNPVLDFDNTALKNTTRRA